MAEIRFISDDQLDEFHRAIEFGFGNDVREEDIDELRRLWLAARTPGTAMAAFDRGRMVATFSSLDFDLTVPGGGSVPMAGTTAVTVHSTHRRQGLLTGMMRAHLEQAIERDQPLAGLWASEERIYGRFGYGVACHAYTTTVPTHLVTLPPGPDDVTMRNLTTDEAREALPPIYEQARPQTPGMLSRSPAWWEVRHLHDPPHDRDGAGAKRYVLAERGAGRAVGYAVYRLKRDWAEVPTGTVDVQELVALDDGVRRSLWHFLSNIDLHPNVNWWNVPIDDPGMLEADRYRAIVRKPFDTLWLRVLDVQRALEARRYERDGTVTLRVTDGFCGRGGTFTLDVDDGAVTCKRASASDPVEAEIELDISDLGALYLGGVPAVRLARAGRLTGAPDVVRAVDDLFRTIRQPHCIEVF